MQPAGSNVAANTYCFSNPKVVRDQIPDTAVDPTALDPPVNANGIYDPLLKRAFNASPAQIEAREYTQFDRTTLCKSKGSSEDEILARFLKWDSGQPKKDV